MRFLVESTRIKNTLFSYRTALSEANVKPNRMGSRKWRKLTYRKEQNFATNHFTFLKISAYYQNSLFKMLTIQISIFMHLVSV